MFMNFILKSFHLEVQSFFGKLCRDLPFPEFWMKRKDFASPDVEIYGKTENSAAIRQNLFNILNLFSDFLKLALHINDDASDASVVSL